MGADFDIIVIGGGIMGAPAARELAERGARVAVVASPEPSDPASHRGPFGAHYDVSRLIWGQHTDPLDTQLATRSMALLEDRHARSGGIILGRGSLFATAPDRDEGRIEAATAAGFEVHGAPALMRLHPSLSLPDEVVGLVDGDSPSLLDPRRLIAVDLDATRQAGGTVLNDVASSTELASPAVIRLGSGSVITANQVIVAGGAFSNLPGLLPRPLALRFKEESVLLARVDDEVALHLSDYPPFVYQLAASDISDVYSAPPLRYPDDHVYLKWGANTLADRWVSSHTAINGWYRSGNSDPGAAMIMAHLERTVPVLAGAEWESRRCVVTYTPHGQPMIDEVVPGRLFVGVGGNGRSAKFSPILGSMIADLVLGHGWEDTPRDRFRAIHEGDAVREWLIRDLWSERAS